MSTRLAVAKDIGLVKGEAQAMTGKTLDTLSDADLLKGSRPSRVRPHHPSTNPPGDALKKQAHCGMTATA